MANIDLVKVAQDCLKPSLPHDLEILAKWKLNDILRAEITKPRNSKFHRKFFALLNIAFENQDKYDNFSDFRVEISLKCGSYREHITTKGVIIYVPKSIAFSNMDELEFSELYDKALDVIIKHFCQGSTEEELNNRVLEILTFS